LTRPTFAHIDLNALRQNYQYASQLHGGRTLAVMKANAYGHGAVRCAQAIQDMADGYAVAFTEEALELRAHGIVKPILVLEGVFDEQEMAIAFENQLSIVIHQHEQVELLERYIQKNTSRTHPNSSPASQNHGQCLQNNDRNDSIAEDRHSHHAHQIDVWLKVDTGMHRLGFHPSEIASVEQRLRSHHLVRCVTLMTHFSRADETDSAYTQQQIQAFDQIAGGKIQDASLCNSAGILAWPSARREWGRAGLMMYGADPTFSSVMAPSAQTASTTTEVKPHHNHLLPVMTLNSKVIAVRSVPAGEPIGYGAGYVTQRPTRIGVVAIGYGDGYPRHAATGTPVLVNKQLTNLIGRVCMDMLMVDLTDLPDTGIGSDVELWGKNLNVCVIAHHVGTVAHALLTGVMRVKRIH